MSLQPSKPHILAILFDEVPEYGRSVRDIIRVEGCDANAKRRLRRLVLKMHGYSCEFDPYTIRYEIDDGTGDGEGRRAVDVTHRYRQPS